MMAARNEPAIPTAAPKRIASTTTTLRKAKGMIDLDGCGENRMATRAAARLQTSSPASNGHHFEFKRDSFNLAESSGAPEP